MWGLGGMKPFTGLLFFKFVWPFQYFWMICAYDLSILCNNNSQKCEATQIQSSEILLYEITSIAVEI